MWNWSFPQCLTMYLLAQMRLASSASLESCSYSSETMWMHRGKSSTWVFLAPRSKMRILGSDGEECLTEYNTHYTVHAHAHTHTHTHMQHTHTHTHTHTPTHATHAHPPTPTTHQTHTPMHPPRVHTHPHPHTSTPHAHTPSPHAPQLTWYSSTEPGPRVGLVLTVPVATQSGGEEGKKRHVRKISQGTHALVTYQRAGLRPIVFLYTQHTWLG